MLNLEFYFLFELICTEWIKNSRLHFVYKTFALKFTNYARLLRNYNLRVNLNYRRRTWLPRTKVYRAITHELKRISKSIANC